MWCTLRKLAACHLHAWRTAPGGAVLFRPSRCSGQPSVCARLCLGTRPTTVMPSWGTSCPARERRGAQGSCAYDILSSDTQVADGGEHPGGPERVESMRLRPDSIALGPSPAGSRCTTPIRRSPSPRRSAAGFSDAVSDLVDIVKYETSRRGRARARLHGDEFLRAGESPHRGRSPSRRSGRRSRSPSSEFRGSTWLGRRSRSPSPDDRRAPPTSEYYGRSQLVQRSRSPSPAASAHSLPAQRRRLPPTPAKPSTLRLDARSMDTGINFPSVSQSPTLPGARSPGSINFPKVNASPTHSLAKLYGPRQLPSPQIPMPQVPNGYKPRLRRTDQESPQQPQPPQQDPNRPGHWC